ncbi:hypothetical protein ACKI1J_07645 [Streptomyces scabiei]
MAAPARPTRRALTLLHVDDDFAAITKVRPGLSVVRGQPQR